MTCMGMLWNGSRTTTHQIIFLTSVNQIFIMVLILQLKKNIPFEVVRGGAWGGLHDAGTPEGLRSAKRYAFTEWTRSFQIGFRCAMDILNKFYYFVFLPLLRIQPEICFS